MVKNYEKKSIFRSKIFFELFCIPSIVEIILSLLLLISDKGDKDPLTFSDIIIVDFIFIFIWFIISLIIIFIINIIKSKCKKSKKKELKIENKKTTNIKNYSVIKYLMITLFIITIATLWIGLIVSSIMNELTNSTNYMWVFYCLIPIPLLSIILGIIFRLKGLKCTKNIVGGIIITIILLIYGSFSLYPVLNEGYDNIYKYKDIIGINIPKKSISSDITKYSGVIDKNKYNFITMTVKYNYEDNSNIILSIENNPNWVSSVNYDKSMKEFFSSTFKKDKHVYYSIYNMTTNEYNALPKKDGKYKIIGMFYNTNYGILYIQSYDIEYKLKKSN